MEPGPGRDFARAHATSAGVVYMVANDISLATAASGEGSNQNIRPRKLRRSEGKRRCSFSQNVVYIVLFAKRGYPIPLQE